MNALLILALLAGTVYFLFLAGCLWSWIRLPVETMKSITAEQVTVIVPARNESQFIVRCLESLAAQDYPHLEFIVVDDDSSDSTPKLVDEFFGVHKHLDGKLIRLAGLENESGPYKKRAIHCGIEAARGSWILTTDADCVATPGWVSSMIDFACRKQAVLVAGPVVMSGEESLLEKMQSLEFAGLVGLGAASLSGGVPMMCNGASLAYSRQAFRDCGGYAGDEQASGDDTSLLYSMHHRFPGKVVFLKSEAAIVKTHSQPDAPSIFRQRVRWSSKIPVAANTVTRLVAASAFLFHTAILVGLFVPGITFYAILAWALKSFVEFIFLERVTAFFKKQSLLGYFLFAQILYPLYIVITGLLALRGEYSWKGRKQVVN